MITKTEFEKLIESFDSAVRGVVFCVGPPAKAVQWKKEKRDALLAAYAAQDTCIAELEAALRWMVNLAHDVGKSGGRPEPGEFEAATEAGMVALKEEQCSDEDAT